VDNPRTDEEVTTSSVDHRGRVVLVTGGTKGVGRGIAAAYRDAGATVVVCARAEPDVAEGGPTFLPCDVRDPDQVTALVDGIVERFGRLDVAVNNAGGAPWADSATASPRFNEKIIALNLLAPLTVAQAANRVMQGQPDGGAVVNIASVSGTRPSPGTAAYGAAKAGLLNLTQTLAVEWAPKVRVNAVIAGLIATEQAHLFYGDEAAQARVARTVPAARLGTPHDVGAACLFLSSPLAAYVTGAALAVHGGNERPAYLDAVQRG
jgi:NAD(P)-dependent dehydrogenase (short-subunit alcohol dehydrogenase family)